MQNGFVLISVLSVFFVKSDRVFKKDFARVFERWLNFLFSFAHVVIREKKIIYFEEKLVKQTKFIDNI